MIGYSIHRYLNSSDTDDDDSSDTDDDDSSDSDDDDRDDDDSDDDDSDDDDSDDVTISHKFSICYGWCLPWYLTE